MHITVIPEQKSENNHTHSASTQLLSVIREEYNVDRERVHNPKRLSGYREGSPHSIDNGYSQVRKPKKTTLMQTYNKINDSALGEGGDREI